MNLLLWKQSWSGPCQNPLKGHDTYRDPSKFIASSVEEQESPADGIWRLGTRENTDQVHEPFKKSISFNGIRHSVHLPWKVHLPEPLSNYGTCFCCLETQIQRLEMDPEILKLYQHHRPAAMKEGGGECRKASRIHYLPHQAVVCKDSATIYPGKSGI